MTKEQHKLIHRDLMKLLFEKIKSNLIDEAQKVMDLLSDLKRI